LTSGPAADAETVADPWDYADPTHWIAKPAMDMVIVTPHNKTVPGGYGPTTDTDGFWSDWNPRYAAGGAQPVYDTLPPRFDAMVVDEIMPVYNRATTVDLEPL
jgi:hypothetical protein